MTRFEDRVLTGRRAAPPGEGVSPATARPTSGVVIPFDGTDNIDFALDDLVETLVAVFRFHPHIGNVFNHVSGGRWTEVGQALRSILDPNSTHGELSALANNILELLWAERGVTGRILKPCFCNLLNGLLPPRLASRLCGQVSELFLQMEIRRYDDPAPRADVGADEGAPAADGGGPQSSAPLSPSRADALTPPAARRPAAAEAPAGGGQPRESAGRS